MTPPAAALAIAGALALPLARTAARAPREAGTCRPSGVDADTGVGTRRRWLVPETPPTRELMVRYGLAAVAPSHF